MIEINDVISNPLKYSDEEKQDMLRTWLKDSYEIEVKDEKILLELFAVHKHGEGELHLGHPAVKNSFGPGGSFHLVNRPEGWHLGFKPDRGNQVLLIHPKHEAGSWASKQNESILLMAKNLLNNGNLIGDVTYSRSLIEENFVQSAPPKKKPEFISKSPEAILEKNEDFNSLQNSSDPLANFIISGGDEILSTGMVESVDNNLDNTVTMKEIENASTISFEVDLSQYLTKD